MISAQCMPPAQVTRGPRGSALEARRGPRHRRAPFCPQTWDTNPAAGGYGHTATWAALPGTEQDVEGALPGASGQEHCPMPGSSLPGRGHQVTTPQVTARGVQLQTPRVQLESHSCSSAWSWPLHQQPALTPTGQSPRNSTRGDWLIRGGGPSSLGTGT